MSNQFINTNYCPAPAPATPRETCSTTVLFDIMGVTIPFLEEPSALDPAQLDNHWRTVVLPGYTGSLADLLQLIDQALAQSTSTNRVHVVQGTGQPNDDMVRFHFCSGIEVVQSVLNASSSQAPLVQAFNRNGSNHNCFQWVWRNGDWVRVVNLDLVLMRDGQPVVLLPSSYSRNGGTPLGVLRLTVAI